MIGIHQHLSDSHSMCSRNNGCTSFQFTKIVYILNFFTLMLLDEVGEVIHCPPVFLSDNV